VNWTSNFLKIVQDHEFSENSFYQEKRVGLGLSGMILICKKCFDWES